jgi:hypothetical protein
LDSLFLFSKKESQMTQSNTSSTETTPGRFIDVTPTWGEIGLLFIRLAMSKELRALEAAKPEFAKAFALAAAMVAINGTLNDTQRAMVAETMRLELNKQGQGAAAKSSDQRL